MRMIIFAFTVLMTSSHIYAAPIFKDFDDLFQFNLPDIGAECKQLGCPANTTACSKHIKTTEDRKDIETDIKCYDSHNNLSASKTNTEKNPDQNSIENSYVFYGSFTEGTQTGTENVNKEINTKVDDTVETLDK